MSFIDQYTGRMTIEIRKKQLDIYLFGYVLAVRFYTMNVFCLGFCFGREKSIKLSNIIEA